MSKHSILFRVEGGNKIGLGHINRSLQLMKALSSKYFISVVSIFNDDAEDVQLGINELMKYDIDCKLIAASNFVEYIKETTPDLLVVDTYNIVSNELSEIKKSGIKVCIFDDNADLDFYDVDIIFNGNVHGEEIRYNCSENTRVLSGLNYTILREEFIKGNDDISEFKSRNEILITMGGTDPQNCTRKILDLIKDLVQYKFCVVLGPGYQWVDDVIKHFSGFNHIDIHVSPNMSRMMRSSSIAITALGTTVYELIAMNIPIIGLECADNQRLAMECLSKKKLILSLGKAEDLTFSKLETTLKSMECTELQNEIITKYRAIDSSKGVNRILSVIDNLLDNSIS